MRLRHAKTLITGKPGVGKTTLVQKIIDRMRSINMAGFLTTEIRDRKSRLGFELQGLNGDRRILAHVEIDSRHRVGRYGVDTRGFEEFLSALDLLNPDVELIVIDEIGKMELFSGRFRNLVRAVMNSDKQVLASISMKGNEFIMEVKQRSDTHLVEVTHNNRNRLVETIVEELKA
jgi:nucleoside-triphosphatase